MKCGCLCCNDAGGRFHFNQRGRVINVPKKKRKYATADHAKRDRELKEAWDKVLNKHPAKVTLPKPTGPVDRDVQLALQRMRRTNLDAAPSVGVVDRVYQSKEKQKLTKEMQEREKAAQAEIARKMKQVAPIANKMGYQYIGNPEDFKTMGRKV